MEGWTDAEHWTAVIPTAVGEVTVSRTGGRVELLRDRAAGAVVMVDLIQAASPAGELKLVRDSFQKAAQTYSRFPEIIYYRIKVSQLLLVMLAGQELVLFLARRRLAGLAHGVRIASWVCWTAGGLWLWLVYFDVAR